MKKHYLKVALIWLSLSLAALFINNLTPAADSVPKNFIYYSRNGKTGGAVAVAFYHQTIIITDDGILKSKFSTEYPFPDNPENLRDVTFSGKLSDEDLRQLYDLIKKADFFNLENGPSEDLSQCLDGYGGNESLEIYLEGNKKAIERNEGIRPIVDKLYYLKEKIRKELL